MTYTNGARDSTNDQGSMSAVSVALTTQQLLLRYAKLHWCTCTDNCRTAAAKRAHTYTYKLRGKTKKHTKTDLAAIAIYIIPFVKNM